MQEILFRGKTTKKDNPNHAFNSVWIEGDLITNKGKCYIHPKCNAVDVQGELGKIIIMHEVEPETVCQYTGLRDKNDKKIFENDILRCHGNDKDLCKVVFGKFYVIDTETLEKVDEVCGWHTEVIETDHLSKCEPFCFDMPFNEFYINRAECEVIGNIFDNQELLGQSSE